MTEKQFGHILDATIIIAIAIIAIIACTSCASTKPVVLNHTIHDTTYIDRTRVDSVLRHDSVYLEVFTRGDTVYRTKYVDRFRDRIRIKTDTVYAMRTDSINVPKAVYKKVQPWERSIFKNTNILLPLGIFCACICFIGWIWFLHRKLQ